MDYFLSKLRTYKFATRHTFEELATILETNVATVHYLFTDENGNTSPKKNIEKRFCEVIDQLRKRDYTQFPSLFFPRIPELTYICFDGAGRSWKGFCGENKPEYVDNHPRSYLPGRDIPSFGHDLSFFSVPMYPSNIRGYYCPSFAHSIIKQTPEGWEEVSSFYERSRPKSKQLFNITFNRHESASLTKPPRKPRTVKH